MNYNFREIEAKWQAYLAGKADIPGRYRGKTAKILLPGNVPLSFRLGTPCRPPEELRAHRRLLPLQEHAGLQCAASHGLGRLRPAGRERGHPPRPQPARDGARICRHLPRDAGQDRLLLRLAARDQLQPARLLQVDAVDVPAAAPQGAGLPGHRAHQLVPRLQDRPGQRGGQGRPLLALRHRRRKEADAAMVLPHHRLRRPPAGRPGKARLVRGHEGDAARLDRPQRGGRGRFRRRRRPA